MLRFDGLASDVTCFKSLVNRMLHIVARRGSTQLQCGHILFGMGLQLGHTLCCLACTQHQYARCQRVERSCVPNLYALNAKTSRQQVPYARQRPERSNLVGLVDADNLAFLDVH